jgi:2'-5' RNA ligase
MAAERLFFALWPPASVRDALAAEVRALPGGAGRVHHPDDLHLTLLFVGGVADDVRPCVEAIGDGVVAGPFQLRLDEAGYWSRPRIRWCRPSTVPADLLDLVGQLQAAMRDCGLEPEARPYRPHVTLARKAAPLRAQPLSTPVVWDVDSFVLAASGSETPPRYRALRRWALAG